MKSNRIYILLLLTICAAFLPALVLRDFNPLNELNYLGIAQESLERGTLFAFYQDGVPYSDKPPLYLWICMAAVLIAGKYAMPVVLLGSLLPFIYLIALLDRYLAYEFRHQERLLIMLGMCSVLVMDVCAMLGRMDMLFSMFMLLSYVKIVKRYSLIQGQGVDEKRTKFGNLSIPFLLFVAIFVKGPYGLLFPLASTVLMLAFNRDLKSFFALIRPHYFILVLLLVLLWAVCVYIDGGAAYLEELFFEQSAKRLGALEGVRIVHQEPFYFFFKIFLVMTLPIGLCFVYFALRQLYLRERLELKISACLSFVLVAVLILSIPKSKLEIYLLPAIPMAYFYVILSYRDMMLKRRAAAAPQAALAAWAAPSALSAEQTSPDAKEVVITSGEQDAPAATLDETEPEAKSSAKNQDTDGAASKLAESLEDKVKDSNSSAPTIKVKSAHSGKAWDMVAANELPAINEEALKADLQADELTLEPLGESKEYQTVSSKSESLALDNQQPSPIKSSLELEEQPHFKHEGIEIVGTGYFLSGINTVGDRAKLPKLLTLSLALPLLIYIALFAAYFVFYDKVPALQNMVVGISFSLLSCISLVALFFLLSRLFIFSLAALGVGTLSFIFCLGFAMPHLNPFLGVGVFANIASQAIDAGASSQVCVYRMRNGLDMSFYDPRIVLTQDPQDLDKCLTNHATIVLNRKGIKELPKLSTKMKEQGAFMLGESLVLPAKRPEPTLPVNVIKQEGLNVPDRLNLSTLNAPSQLKINFKDDLEQPST